MANRERIKLPGFGLPVDFLSSEHDFGKIRFPHAIADYFATSGVTIREQSMMEFINQITDKPNWTEKIYDESIVDKWRQEACGSEHQQRYSDQHLSIKCFDYCVAELRDKAEYLKKHGVVHVLDVIATIVKADMLADDSFIQCLLWAVYPLENVPDLRRDWHPGSNGLVLDLVHPSLCPLIYGKTRILPTSSVPLAKCSEWSSCGETCPELDLDHEYFGRSLGTDDADLQPWGHYQWLPSNLIFDEAGKAKIQSYVNNLHPQYHGDLYSVLEQAVDKAIPLWNDCLSFWHDRLRIQLESTTMEDYRPKELSITDPEGLNKSGAEIQAGVDGGDNPSAGENDDEEDEDDEWEDNQRDWLRDNPDKREIGQPDPEELYMKFEDQMLKHELQRRDLVRDYPAGLQIIFKLANIHLTPEKPLYEGSAWHVEGALNEHICATTLFYYDQENIQESFLEFQHEIDGEDMIMRPGQDEYMTCEDLYGISQEGPPVQSIGRVSTKEGRILAFPNVMQHRIRPFGLADASKPGHRKILAMFLVDPNIRILSTANVPPQQRAWWADEVRKVEPFDGLPVELFERIIEEVDDFPIGWDEACEIREALMAERGRARDEFEEALQQNTFFFCEH